MPAIEYLLPEGALPAALADALGPRLTLADGARTAATRTYYDTFDARVREGDLALFHEDGRLVLARREGVEVATAGVGRVPAAVRVADLAGGALREALAPVLDVRVAERVARVRTGRRVLRVLDGERKTVLHLVVDEPVLAAAGRDGGVPLTARVRLAGVRGYDRALDRVRTVLEEDLGLTQAADAVVDEAVTRAGGRPEGVSSKLDVPLEPAQRADGAAAAVSLRLLEIVEVNLPGTLADADPEFLHDLRVAVRRTRALQRELKAVFPPAALAHARQEFRWLQQVTGPSRDLDVQLLEFGDVAGSLPAWHREDLEPLRALLERRRRRERTTMVRALRSARTRALLEEWRDLLARLGSLPEDDRPAAAHPIAEIAGRRIVAVHRQMVRMGQAIGDDSPHEDLHELRKKGKELRYLLEFFGGLFPAGTVKPMVKSLKALQDTLGRFQDREVQAGVLRSLGPDIARLDDGAAALMAMGVLAARLEQQQTEARAEFAERFAGFVAHPGRAAVKAAFR